MPPQCLEEWYRTSPVSSQTYLVVVLHLELGWRLRRGLIGGLK